MPALLLIPLLLFTQLHAFAQASDFISVRKKNGRTLQTYFAGSPIVFETKRGTQVNGRIRSIENDSVFVSLYDVRRFQTNLGVPLIDTVAMYGIGIHYKDIARVQVHQRLKTSEVTFDKLLMYGGGGYIALNVINGRYLDEPILEKENIKKLGIAAGVFITGIILKYFRANRAGSKRQKIVYVNLQ